MSPKPRPSSGSGDDAGDMARERMEVTKKKQRRWFREGRVFGRRAPRPPQLHSLSATPNRPRSRVDTFPAICQGQKAFPFLDSRSRGQRTKEQLDGAAITRPGNMEQRRANESPTKQASFLRMSSWKTKARELKMAAPWTDDETAASRRRADEGIQVDRAHRDPHPPPV